MRVTELRPWPPGCDLQESNYPSQELGESPNGTGKIVLLHMNEKSEVVQNFILVDTATGKRHAVIFKEEETTVGLVIQATYMLLRAIQKPEVVANTLAHQTLAIAVSGLNRVIGYLTPGV